MRYKRYDWPKDPLLGGGHELLGQDEDIQARPSQGCIPAERLASSICELVFMRIRA